MIVEPVGSLYIFKCLIVLSEKLYIQFRKCKKYKAKCECSWIVHVLISNAFIALLPSTDYRVVSVILASVFVIGKGFQ